jgi:putative MATE family efflux protein
VGLTSTGSDEARKIGDYLSRVRRIRIKASMQDLTSGPVSRHLVKTASFMLVTMVFQTLYFLVDLYWVGRLGKEAVAAVGIAGNLQFIVLAVTQMLAVGATTLVSHAAGQRDQERALLVFNQSQVLAIVVAVVFFAIAWVTRDWYVLQQSADAITAGLAVDYLSWFIPAMALQFAVVGMSAALRGIGNFKPGMVVQTATVIVNIVLAPVLIFGWGTGIAFGVAGAAVATLIAVVVGVVWLATYFVKHDAFLRFVRRDMRPQLALWAAMLKIGLPAGAEFAMMAVYLFIVYRLAAPFGAAAQAGFGIGLRVVQALFMPIVALGFAVAPVAGQNVGARLGTRVKDVFRAASTMAAGYMFVAAVICNIAPAALVATFSGDRQVIAVGDEYLRITSWNFVASGLVFVASSMFQALGNTIPSLVASVSRVLIIVIPAMWLAQLQGFQLRWIWYLSVIAIVLQLTIILLLLRREFRLKFETSAVPAA